MSRVLEIYRGYEIVSGSPEYGKQFAYAWRLTDESSFQFNETIEACKSEIDDLLYEDGSLK